MTTSSWKVSLVAAALAVGAPAFAQSSGPAKLDKGLEEAAQKLHASNLGEVQAGTTAQQAAQSPEVKQFAQRMIDDHQKNDQQLQSLAQTMGASLQGKAFQGKQKKSEGDMKKLAGKSGAAFDKAYMKMMVSEHKNDVKEIGKAAKAAHKKNQAELAAFLDQTHSQLQSHLQEAERVEKSLGKGGGSSSSGASSMGSESSASPGGSPSGSSSSSAGGGGR